MLEILNKFISFAKKQQITDDTFVVGGSVRDIILGREIKDIDLAVKGNAINIARVFASNTNASFVLLDEKFEIARIVFNKQFFDISTLRGETIRDDLSERDITINAMAIPLADINKPPGDITIIDPHSGQSDLANKIIRMVAENNMISDPLRILRAYRFSATLDFAIEEVTHQFIRNLSCLLTRVASERIAEELRHITVVDNSYKTIRLMINDAVLHNALDFAKQTDEQLTSNLFIYKNTEMLVNDPDIFGEYKNYFIEYFDADYKKTCLKLSTLFTDHRQARRNAIRLKMSKKEIDFMHLMVQHNMTILKSAEKNEHLADKRETIKYIKEFGDNIYPLLTLAVARSMTNYDSFSALSFSHDLLQMYHRDLKPRFKMLPVITGEDLIAEINITPSPVFKEILSYIEDMVLEGQINSRNEALEEVKKFLGRQ